MGFRGLIFVLLFHWTLLLPLPCKWRKNFLESALRQLKCSNTIIFGCCPPFSTVQSNRLSFFQLQLNENKKVRYFFTEFGSDGGKKQ